MMHASGETPACPQCGAPTEIVWTTPSNVQSDEFTKPLVDDTMDKRTQVFYTRSEWKAAMRKRGIRPMEKGDLGEILKGIR